MQPCSPLTATPARQRALDQAREDLGTTAEIANALADNLPVPKLTARKSRRRRRKRKGPPLGDAAATQANETTSPTEVVPLAVAEPPVDESSEDAA